MKYNLWNIGTDEKIVTFALIIILSTVLAQSQEIAEGTVFNDKNRNGIFDKDEQGIEKVLVSNQKDVVITDKNGYYSIPVTKQSVIFITKPGDYDIPLDMHNIPQFFYIHQPEGSPQLEYKGLNPTEELPDQINFPLYKTEKKDNFKLLVFADVQVASIKEIYYFRQDVIANVLNQKVDVAVSLGDLVHDELSLLSDYNESMSQIGIPHYSVQGNHDVNYDTDEQYSSETFKKFYGPNYYSFDYGNVHFICLENIERYCSKNNSDEWWNCYRGKIDKVQLTWLKNDLKHIPDNQLIVICQHIPFQTYPSKDERSIVVNRNEVFNALKQKDNVLVLAGHTHTLEHNYFTEKEDWQGKSELHQIICGSVSGSWWTGPDDDSGIPVATQIDGVPNGYFIIEFKNNSYVHNYYQAGNSSSQLRIEKPQKVISSKEREIIVNIFNSNKYTKGIAILDNKEEIKLKNEIIIDPFFKNLFEEQREDFKSWVTPAKSTQIWIGELPATVEKGIHTLKIKVVDEYNRIKTAYSIFEIN